MDSCKTCDNKSEAGKNREGEKLQISTGRRVFSQITAMPVISSDKSQVRATL
jgi:hypothetical protein